MSTDHNNNEYRKFAESTRPLNKELPIVERILALSNLFLTQTGSEPEYIEIGRDEYRELYEGKCAEFIGIELRSAEVVYSGYMAAAGDDRVLIGNWPSFNLFYAEKRYSPIGFQKSIIASVSNSKAKDE